MTELGHKVRKHLEKNVGSIGKKMQETYGLATDIIAIVACDLGLKDDLACKWTQQSGEGGCYEDTYEMECDGLFTIHEGSLKDNHMNFCPTCGKKIWPVLVGGES